MESMFNSASSFNRDLNRWSLAKLTVAASMFRFAVAFNGNVFAWDLSNVTGAANMFTGATSFDQSLCWTLRDGADTTSMFSGSAGASLLARGSCIKCAPGQYRLDAFTCGDCAPGFFGSAYNQSTCDDACPAGR